MKRTIIYALVWLLLGVTGTFAGAKANPTNKITMLGTIALTLGGPVTFTVGATIYLIPYVQQCVFNCEEK